MAAERWRLLVEKDLELCKKYDEVIALQDRLRAAQGLVAKPVDVQALSSASGPSAPPKPPRCFQLGGTLSKGFGTTCDGFFSL